MMLMMKDALPTAVQHSFYVTKSCLKQQITFAQCITKDFLIGVVICRSLVFWMADERMMQPFQKK